MLDHLLGHAGHIRDPVDHLSPVDAQLAAQPMAKMGFVEVAGGFSVRVDQPGVERAPPAIGPLAEVGDQDMGVEMRIARA